jgi:hypothetical protein
MTAQFTVRDPVWPLPAKSSQIFRRPMLNTFLCQYKPEMQQGEYGSIPSALPFPGGPKEDLKIEMISPE